MAFLWAFDPVKVAERSLVVEWLRNGKNAGHNNSLLTAARNELGANDKLLPIENLPSQEEIELGFKPVVATITTPSEKEKEKASKKKGGFFSKKN